MSANQTPGPAHRRGGRVWMVLKTLQARLRFIVILVAIGLVIGNWTLLTAYWERWLRPAADTQAASGHEFYCSMHLQIVRDKPDKCPICGMPLSERKKGAAGDDEALAPGTNRVQLSPYRVALAGLKTWEVKYQPLTKEIRTVGFVEFDERRLARISAWVPGKNRITKLHVNVTGQTVKKGEELAQLYNSELVNTAQNLIDASRGNNKNLEQMAHTRLKLWGIGEDEINAIVKSGQPVDHVTIRSTIKGHVIKKYAVEGQYVEEGAPLFDIAELSTVWIEAQVYEDEIAFLKEGLDVSATTKAFPNRVFSGKVDFVHPHLDASTRTLKVRFNMKNSDHDLRPGMYATVRVEIPTAQLDGFRHALEEDWRNGTIVSGMAHGASAAVLAPQNSVESLMETAGKLALLRRGLVLAVPESAVIDTGSRKFVYRQAWPGAYDAVEIWLGPRSGGFFAVVRGLAAGDKVVTAGSFLVDAETRLTSGAASTYFGASGGSQTDKHASRMEARPSMTSDQDTKVNAALAKLSRVDQRLAAAQGNCPILPENRLGSMGLPVKVMLKEEPVFLCCSGCESKARAQAEVTLAKVRVLKANVKAGTASAPK